MSHTVPRSRRDRLKRFRTRSGLKANVSPDAPELLVAVAAVSNHLETYTHLVHELATKLACPNQEESPVLPFVGLSPRGTINVGRKTLAVT